MITRSLGKIVRGRCTPFQLLAASVLGACLGFLPGFVEAPGLALSLGLALAVLNANLFVAGGVAAGCSLAALALQPQLFALGRFVLDGPTTGLARQVVNTPGLALFGFERYVTSGGLLLGLVLGTVIGLVLTGTQARLRARLAAAEARSEGAAAEGAAPETGWRDRRSVRLAVFVLVGGPPKQGYAALQAQRLGNPLRLVGVAGALALGGLLWAGQAALGSALMQNALQRGLERANGATVDLAALELNPAQGRFALEGLALADPDALTRDLFRGRTFEADLSMGDLLTKRLVVERLVVRSAASGEERAIPGERVETGDPPVTETPDEEDAWSLPGDQTLEDVLADAELWRGRLETVRDLLARFGGEAVEDDPGAPETPTEESLRERLQRQAEAWGYREVLASHLFDAEPRVRVDEVVVEDFRLEAFPGQRFTLRLQSLTSSLALQDEGPRLSLRTADDSLVFDFSLGALESRGTMEAPHDRAAHLSFALRGVPVDSIADQVVVDGQRVVSGGTLDVQLAGRYLDGGIELPLEVLLRGTTLSLPGYDPVTVERFALPIGIRGPLDSPRLTIDDDQLVDALVQAGKDELARRVRAEADARLAEARDALDAHLREELSEQLGDLDLGGLAPEDLGLDGTLVEELLESTPKLELPVPDDLEQKAADQLGRHLGDGLDGLGGFFGKRKDG